MNTTLYKIIETQLSETCTRPAVGDQLADYIAGLLAVAEAKQVEDHLLDCLHCREFFLLMQDIRGEEGELTASRDGGDELEVRVESLERFKRRRA